MIKKKALIELVRHRVVGEYQAKQMGKVGDQMIAAYIGRAFNSLLLDVFRANLANFDPYTKEYTDVDIDQDSNTEVYYSELPAPVIQLPKLWKLLSNTFPDHYLVLMIQLKQTSHLFYLIMTAYWM